MAQQLIYTSSPRGLTSGRTGFVTVARHREIASRLVTELEKDSGYEWVTGSEVQPVVKRYSLYGSGSSSARVLTRVLPAGLDFTHRPCHLAHHLVVSRGEPVMGSPLDWLMGWPGFHSEWKEEPRWLEAQDQIAVGSPEFPVGVAPSLPGKLPASREFWKMLPSSARARPIFLYEPGQEGLLLQIWQWLFAQVSPARQWEITFTTFLQTPEISDRYTWCAGWPGSAAALLAKKEPHRVVDLTTNSLSDGLQRLVLNGEDLPVVQEAPVRRYASGTQVEEKRAIHRPVGRTSQDNHSVSVECEKVSNPRMYAPILWILLGIGAMVALFGAWIWTSSDQSDHSLPPTFTNGHAEDASWLIFPDSKSGDGLGKPEETEDLEKQWQNAQSAGTVAAVHRFAERLRGNSAEVESMRARVDEWLHEREKIRLLLQQQITDLAQLDKGWNEVQWNQNVVRLPVEWREELGAQRQAWMQVRDWLHRMPKDALFLLTGNEDRWVLPVRGTSADMADTTWSAVSSLAHVDGQKELPLQLLQIAGQYRVVYDIFSVLRIQPYGGAQSQWDLRMDTLPADALRKHPELFILQQSPEFRVSAKGKVVFVLRRVSAGYQWPDSVQTLSVRSAIKENARGDAQLTTWLSDLLGRLHWVKGGEVQENGHWIWENNRDEWLVARETENSEFVLSRTKMTPVGNKSSSGVSITNGQLRPVQVDWVLRNGPWKIRWSTSTPGEESVLLILE
jgi:hypothetical protein